MQKLFEINLQEIFVPSVSLIEIFIRGSLMYLALFLALRFLRRGIGAIGITDLLVIVLVADAAQNGMAGDYKSVTEGVLLVATIAGWDMLLDWLGSKSQFFERLLRPAPLTLVKEGKKLRRNMQREMITEEELMSQLRQQGIEDISEVKSACLEGDGNLSVIKSEKSSDEGKGKERNKEKTIG